MPYQNPIDNSTELLICSWNFVNFKLNYIIFQGCEAHNKVSEENPVNSLL